MEYDLILKNVAKHITLTPAESDFFISILHSKKIRRRQYLLQEGNVCKFSTFITRGCLRSYSIDKNGHEHIMQFAIEDWWIGDMHSYKTQKPGKLNIDALEDSELLILNVEDQEKLLVDVPKFERFFRIIAENSLVSHQKRILEYISAPALERYLNFINSYPLMAQRLPQTQIAAYLGITPEFLSKLRQELVKK